MFASISSVPGVESTGRPSLSNRKCILGFIKAYLVTISTICSSSTASDFIYFFRAGVLKKRSDTLISVPRGAPQEDISAAFPPSTFIRTASEPPAFVIISTLDTDEMLARASPLKPKVCIEKRSSTSSILLVACLSKESIASSYVIP